jgi:hypothetical protein
MFSRMPAKEPKERSPRIRPRSPRESTAVLIILIPTDPKGYI